MKRHRRAVLHHLLYSRSFTKQPLDNVNFSTYRNISLRALVWLLGQLPWTRRRMHSAWNGLSKTNRICQVKTFQGEDRKLRYVFGTESLRRSEIFLPREVKGFHTCLMNMSKANVRILLTVQVSRHSCELCVWFHLDKALRALSLRLCPWRLCCHALTYVYMHVRHISRTQQIL